MATEPKYAFRCKTCGKLHEAEHAAEALHPHACRVCGSGVSFDPKTGVKKIHPENWDVLAELTEGQLSEYDLKKEHVEAHKPWPQSKPDHVPQQLTAEAQDGTKTSNQPG